MKIPFFNKLQCALSVEVSYTCFKNSEVCSLPTVSQLCVGLTESRTQYRWVAEYVSDSQHFVRRVACE